MGKKVVSILDYRTSKNITNIERLLAKAGRRGKVHPRSWKREQMQFRSLTVYDDGTCLLDRRTVASVTRKMKDGSVMKGVKS